MQICGCSRRLATTTAGDGGDDGEFVRGGDGGVFLGGEVADVVVVEVDVDEGPQLALWRIEVLLHRGMRGDERGEAFVHGGAGDRDSFLLVSVGAQRGGDVYFHGLIIAYRRFPRRALPISYASNGLALRPGGTRDEENFDYWSNGAGG